MSKPLKPAERTQAVALGAYLRTVSPGVLTFALGEIGATPAPVEISTPNRRVCQTCGMVYPRCRAAWADDHEFEAPRCP